MVRQYMPIQAVPSDCSRCPPVGSGAAIKHVDIVEAQEPALEDVVPISVFAIHPPGEVEQELVKHALQEGAVGLAGDTLLDLVHPPGCPGMHRRVDIAEAPFIGGQLPVGMHVPLAQEQDELLLG
jgi:hypothetical protein